MKILHVITTINRGGAENHLHDLISGQISQHGGEVACAWLKGDSYWVPDFEKIGVKLFPLRLERYGQLMPAWRLRNAIRNFKPDVVHAHMPPAELYIRLALLLLSDSNPQLVISKHNDEPFYRGFGHQLLGRWVARPACRIVTISDAVKNYMADQLGLPAAKLITIHYGIDPSPFQDVSSQAVHALRGAWGIPPQAWVIGTVARFVPQKALHVLLQGYADYRASASKPSRLVLVGRGALESELKVEAQRLGIASDIVWAGYREDIPVVMRAFDCFALTSIYEGFGLVLIEAMAAGRPVIATAVSAIPEVVHGEKTGLLVPVNEPTSLAAAFSRLENEAERNQMGYAGLALTKSYFTLDRMVSSTIRIYQECLCNKAQKDFTG